MLFEWLPECLLMLFLPDTFRCQHHSAGWSPAGCLHAIAQSGLPGTGRIRGMRLPQRQDLPLSCREQLHLPGHEQHLPLELTWKQCRWSGTPLTSAPDLLRWRLFHLFNRDGAETFHCLSWSIRVHCLQWSVWGQDPCAPTMFEEWQSERLSKIRNITYEQGHFHYLISESEASLYFSTLGSW